jgi:hypothetical protein
MRQWIYLRRTGKILRSGATKEQERLCMNEKQFDQWIRKIITTEEEEISCSDCFDRISEYVDAEIAGKKMDQALAQVQHHLKQCQVCHEEYTLVHELAAGEQ